MPETEIFSDIHCHTFLKYVQNDVTDLWDPIGRPNFISKALGLVRFTAADLRKLAEGDVQIICVTLTPPEQKLFFFQGGIPRFLLNRFTTFISTIPADKVKFYQSPDYDHFELLNQELRLCLKGQNVTQEIRLPSTGKKTLCRYKVVKNFGEIAAILEANKNNTDERTIAVVLTIEAFHALGRGHIEFNGAPNKFNVSDEMILKRIDALKGIGSAEVAAWEQSPLWITIAHAVNNDICGHAQPLTDRFRSFLDYSEPFDGKKGPPKYQSCLNTGLKPLGKAVIERMLGIDAVSLARPDRGKRILVDTKHLSTRSRQDFYDILDAYHAAQPTDIIPVVSSHAAVNGKPRLDEQGFNPADKDQEWKNSDSFNPWSINLYDDEIVRIHQTKGLIGLVFYQPILGGKKRRRGTFFWSEEDWVSLFIDQVEHIVRTVYNTGAADKHLVWDCICIGSDFDGQINPANKFASSDRLTIFKKHLKRFLNSDRFNPYRNPAEVNELADKISYKNVVEFLKRNF
jgi:microsomal dipeptidase-like Zn-dependent dipeptidase